MLIAQQTAAAAADAQIQLQSYRYGYGYRDRYMHTFGARASSTLN